MNKKFKALAAVACGAVIAAGAVAFSACGGTSVSVQYTGTGSEYIVEHSDGQTVTYTFEAEYTNLENKAGTAFSGERSGVNMVVEGDSSASNGYAVAGLCKRGLSVNFVIVCDRDVENATLILRLGNETVPPEYVFSVTAETFLVRVDPVTDEDVEPYTESGAWGSWDQFFLDYYSGDNFQGYYLDSFTCGTIDFATTTQETASSGFDDYTVCTTLSLQKGLNCISLITNNDDIPDAGTYGATLFATAPVVDCIKIVTDAQMGLYNPQQNQSYLDVSKACTYK